MYVIKAIKSPSALLEEILDESQRICDVQPYFALFRISEREENESEDINLNKNINSLIGKKLDDFKTLKNPEVQLSVAYFFPHISQSCKQIVLYCIVL